MPMAEPKRRKTRPALLGLAGGALTLLLLPSGPAFAQRDEPLPGPARTIDSEDPTTFKPTVVRRKAAAKRRKVAQPSGHSTVVRAAADNWGMFFRFGGLATLTHGANSRTTGAAVLHHVGLKKVISENWMIPFYAGTALHLRSPDGADATVDFGMELGGGLEYHFRIWRRISPFVGANIGLFFLKPDGDDNWDFSIGLGPNLGVEYYIGDRVSVSALYAFSLNIEIQSRNTPTGAATQTSFGFRTMAGGALNLTYYF